MCNDGKVQCLRDAQVESQSVEGLLNRLLSEETSVLKHNLYFCNKTKRLNFSGCLVSFKLDTVLN